MKRLREPLWAAMAGTGLNALARRRGPARLLIVCYHGVCEDDCPERHWLLVRRSTFARQLDQLRARFAVRDLDSALADLRAGTLREPTAAITFDDGYRNNHTVAWPELRARGLPATIFLATGLISSDATLWTTTLEYAVRGSTAPVLDLRRWNGAHFTLESPAQREAAGEAVKEWLKDAPATRRRQIMADIMDAVAPTSAPPEDFRLLDWTEVREMAASGLVRFGAHTVTHEIVSRLSDEALAREIEESVSAVEALGDAASRVFAFPNGRRQDFDDRAIRLLAARGLAGSVTTVTGVNSARTSPWLLRRFLIAEGISDARFDAEADGMLALIRRLRSPQPHG